MPYPLCSERIADTRQLVLRMPLMPSKNGDHLKVYGWALNALAHVTPGAGMAMTLCRKTLRRMLRIERTDSTNKHFRQLVELLDKELAEIDGEEHQFYHQFNSIADLNYCLVGYQNDKPIACGALKIFNIQGMEIKRMYTSADSRGKGVATQILASLEKWAAELGAKNCLLETGKRQEDAVALYKKNGYEIVPNYGQYIGIANSLCFEKRL